MEESRPDPPFDPSPGDDASRSDVREDGAPDAEASGEDDYLRYSWSLTHRDLGRADWQQLAGVVLLVIGDLAAAALALGLAIAVDPGGWRLSRWYELFPLVGILVVNGQALVGTYAPGQGWRQLGFAVLGAFLSAVTAAVLAALYPAFWISALSFAVMGGALALLATGMRATGDRVLRACYRRGMLRRPALLVGRGESAGAARRWLEEQGYDEIRIVDTVPVPEATVDFAGLPFPELGDRIGGTDARMVLVPRALPEEAFRAVAYQCFLHSAELAVVNPSPRPLPFRVVDQDERGLSRIELAVPRLQPVQVVMKRALDLVLGSTALVLALPVFAVVAAAIVLDSPGPLLFRQERLGKGGRRFQLLKFRSMEPGAEERLRQDPELFRRYLAHDYKLPAEEDPRITRVGRLLRTTSLDELPQLVNVMKGEMSLVGPRPVVPPEIEEYGTYTPVLLGVRPGLTGFWQISGWEDVGYPQRARWEIEYVERWSLWLDLEILARTVPLVLGKLFER